MPFKERPHGKNFQAKKQPRAAMKIVNAAPIVERFSVDEDSDVMTSCDAFCNQVQGEAARPVTFDPPPLRRGHDSS